MKSQIDVTEALIAAPMTRKGIQAWAERRDRLEAHARDLARKLDAVRAECDRWPVATWSETIAAIVEGE